MDALCTGLGGEVTDAELQSASNRPQWLLKPLPLSQVCPVQAEPAGLGSLQSLCLAALSHKFDLLTAEDVAALPAHLARKLVTRLASDRGYDLGAARDPRPDAATLWAFAALQDPDGARASAPTWTLQLPQGALLRQLGGFRRADHPAHPLNALPALFATLRPRAALLTTLTLHALDDAGLQALKHCAHLSVLWTPAARFTDDGVRMLAAATSVPARTGAHSLRAWFLPHSTGVGDRALRSFVRFGGLALLDLRGTSCTSAALQVYNRANAAWDSAPDMLPCTEGLRGLFSAEEPDAVLEKLTMTLLAPDVAAADELEDARAYVSLHLQPAAHELEDDWQHLPPKANLPNYQAAFNANKSFNAAHGQLYGTGVGNIEDDASDLRRRVKTALEMQAEDEHRAHCIATGKPVPPDRQERAYEATKRRRREYNATKKREKEARRNDDWVGGGQRGATKWVWTGNGAYELRHRRGQVVAQTQAQAQAQEAALADARSRRFAAAESKARRPPRMTQAKIEKSTQGDARLMFVRMLGPQWREARWAPATREAAPASQQVSVKRRANAGEEVYDLLASAGIVLDEEELLPSSPPPSQPPASSSPAPARAHPFFASHKPPPSQPASSSPASSQSRPRASNPFAKPAPASQPTQASQGSGSGFNPFKARGKADVSSSGVRKLGDKAVAKVLGEKRPNESSSQEARRNVFRKL